MNGKRQATLMTFLRNQIVSCVLHHFYFSFSQTYLIFPSPCFLKLMIVECSFVLILICCRRKFHCRVIRGTLTCFFLTLLFLFQTKQYADERFDQDGCSCPAEVAKMLFKFGESDSNADQKHMLGNINECNNTAMSIKIEAFNRSDIVQWATTEIRQFVLINSHISGNAYSLKAKRMSSVTIPPPFNE